MENNQVNSGKAVYITVETVVNADIKKVWELWTTPAHIEQWNNASDDWYTPKASNDLRVDGRFSYTMAARDGSMSFDFEGTYTAVKEHELIEYYIVDGRHVSIQFIPVENGVHVIEKFEPESENSLELQQSGWQAIIDNFKKYAESFVG